MTSSSEQPPKHCKHELESSLHLCSKAKNQNGSPCKWETCSDDTRSRQQPAPAQIGFTEFCDIHCDHYECCKDERAEAARKARDDFAKELSDIIKSEWMCDLAEILYIIECVSKGKGNPFSTTPQTEQEQPR